LSQGSEFTNTTNDAADPITGIEWNFGSAGTSIDDPAIVSFLTSGMVNVSLSTTTQSGCVYTVIKPVVISDGPVAAFTATPNNGEAPVRIEFINTSINATEYQWSFNDPNSQTSTQSSPVFTYNTTGLYIAELTASDAQGCTHTTQQLIEVDEAVDVIPPHPNPSRGEFTIEWKTDVGTLTQLRLVDGVGREVQAAQLVSVAGINRFRLDISSRPSGLYILTLNYLGRTQTFRLVLNH
jgi:PKD repeat protein